MPSPTSPNLDDPDPREVSDPHDTSAAAGASEGRSFGLRDALLIYHECGGTWHGPIVEHASCEEKAFHLFVERVIEEARRTATPPVAGTDARETTRQEDSHSERHKMHAQTVPCIHDPVIDAFVPIYSYRGVELAKAKRSPQEARETTRELSEAELDAIDARAIKIFADFGDDFRAPHAGLDPQTVRALVAGYRRAKP